MMNRKSIIIALSLLLLAGAIIIINNRGNNARAAAPGTEHAASPHGGGPFSKPTPESAVKDQDLVARYGEAKTKQAREIAAASINLLRTDTRTMRMLIKEFTKAAMTSEILLGRLDLGDSGIAFSEAQHQKVLELYTNYHGCPVE